MTWNLPDKFLMNDWILPWNESYREIFTYNFVSFLRPYSVLQNVFFYVICDFVILHISGFQFQGDRKLVHVAYHAYLKRHSLLADVSEIQISVYLYVNQKEVTRLNFIVYDRKQDFTTMWWCHTVFPTSEVITDSTYISVYSTLSYVQHVS